MRVVKLQPRQPTDFEKHLGQAVGKRWSEVGIPKCVAGKLPASV